MGSVVPWDLPGAGVEPVSPELAGRFFSHQGSPHMNFRSNLSFLKKGSWNFDGDYIEFLDQFGKHCHVNNIIYQSIKIRYVFPFILTSTFLQHYFIVVSVHTCILFLKFISKYFTLLDAIVTGNVS